MKYLVIGLVLFLTGCERRYDSHDIKNAIELCKGVNSIAELRVYSTFATTECLINVNGVNVIQRFTIEKDEVLYKGD